MASLTYGDVARFPEGTVVGIYADGSVSPGLQKAPTGPALDTETVSGGSVTFTGLSDGMSYWIGGQVEGAWRFVGVATADPVAGLPRLNELNEPDGPVSMDGQHLLGLPAPSDNAEPVRKAEYDEHGQYHKTGGPSAYLSSVTNPNQIYLSDLLPYILKDVDFAGWARLIRLADALEARDGMNKRSVEGLLYADFDVDYSEIADGAPGYDPQSGYKIHLTGDGNMTVSGGFLVNGTENEAGYAVSTLRRRPLKMEATFRLTSGEGDDSADPTVALVACKGAMDFNVYQNLAHFIWTKSSMSFQKFVDGEFSNIATHAYDALSLDTDYTVSVEIDWGTGTVTMTDPFGATHTSSDPDLKANWGRTVFHEIVEQANSPLVKIASCKYTEQRPVTTQARVASQADFWLPQNPDDSTPAIAENVPMGRFQSAAMANLAVLTSGVLYLAGGMVLPEGVPVNRLRFLSGDTAADTPTHQWACLLDRKGRVLAVTEDQEDSAWAADSFKTFEFADPYEAPGPMPVYVGLMVEATTPPSLVGFSTGGKYNWIFANDDGIAGDAAATGLTTPISVDDTRRPINSPSGLTTNLAYVVAE